jgi:hypothetical protein
MSDIQVTLTLPGDLIEQAQAVGIELDSITPDVVAALEDRIKRKQAWQYLMSAADRLRGSLSLEEIEEELAAAKAERLARSESTTE